MMMFKAYRYDGQRSGRRSVTIVFLADRVVVSDDDALSLTYPHSSVEIVPEVAGKFRQLRFSDGSQCDIAVQPGLEEAMAHLPGQAAGRWVFRLENRPLYIVAILLLSVAVIWGLIQYGVPVVSRHIAERIPVEMESSMGDESLRVLMQMTEPSQLAEARQQQLREAFDAFARAAGVEVKQVVFRRGEGIGANAFALPSGIIVFTDEMVMKALQDEELVAVFAHELGHIHHRHAMRHLLQNSLTAVLIILLTGDVGTASTLAATLPTVLIQSAFSRAVEAEADDYAIAVLGQQGLSAAPLGAILLRIEKESGAGDIPGFLSTHPMTEERVRKFGAADSP